MDKTQIMLYKYIYLVLKFENYLMKLQ